MKNLTGILLSLGLCAVVLPGCAQKRLGTVPREAAPKAAAAPEAARPQPVYPQAAPVDRSLPLKIRSNRLRYDDRSARTRFEGNVVVSQDTATLYADQVVTANRDETGVARGHVSLVDTKRQVQVWAQEMEYAARLSQATVRGGLRMVSVDPYGRGVTVTADQGQVWPRAGRAALQGDVDLLRGAVRARAGLARVDQDAGELVMEEAVRVGMGENRFVADKATLKSEGRKLILEGDVRARFTPAQLEAAAERPEALP